MTRPFRPGWLALLIVALAACAPAVTPVAKQTPSVAVSTIAPTATVVVASTPTPTVIPPTPAVVPPTSVPQPTEQQLAQLKDQLLQQLTNGQPLTPDQTLGVSVLPLTTTGTLGPWYAAYSTGSIMDLLPDGRHVLALHEFANNQWHEIQPLQLEASDYVDEAGVQQVPLEPSHIWLEVQSGAGAHSGCYDLFAVDPSSRSVSQHISSCSSSPGAGFTTDVNGDGQLDVVLDGTDYYVFCYACGVTKPQYSVLAWDGKQLSEVKLTPLPVSAPADLLAANNEAAWLASGGLWKDALATSEQAKALNQQHDPVVTWNAALIDLQAQAHQAQVQSESHPLLNNLFYGDYAATLNILRPYPPDQIFSLTGPLIKGTVAEGWEPTLAGWITQTTNSALLVKPNMAAAYFLRGLGEYLANPQDPAALQDVERAAQLAPDEKLFSDSVNYLK